MVVLRCGALGAVLAQLVGLDPGSRVFRAGEGMARCPGLGVS